MDYKIQVRNEKNQLTCDDRDFHFYPIPGGRSLLGINITEFRYGTAAQGVLSSKEFRMPQATFLALIGRAVQEYGQDIPEVEVKNRDIRALSDRVTDMRKRMEDDNIRYKSLQASYAAVLDRTTAAEAQAQDLRMEKAQRSTERPGGYSTKFGAATHAQLQEDLKLSREYGSRQYDARCALGAEVHKFQQANATLIREKAEQEARILRQSETIYNLRKEAEDAAETKQPVIKGVAVFFDQDEVDDFADTYTADEAIMVVQHVEDEED